MGLLEYFSQPKQSNEVLDSYHTIFGFDTTSKVAAKAIDIIYWFIIFVAYCFAFHALDTILVSWNWFLVGLASLAVVGLPYCVKIILFGRREFPLKAALLCGFLSILPAIFDFAGFYSETGLQDSLKTSKVQIVETINYFEAESKKAAQQQILDASVKEREQITELEAQFDETLLEKQKELEKARQEIIDEKTGVKSGSTSGKIGDGPRTRELEANVRKAQAQVELEQKNIKDNIERSSSNIKSDTKQKITAITKSISLLDQKIIETKKEINDAKSFEGLEGAVISANSLISSIASNLNTEFKPVEIQGSSNILQLSFGALFAFEITALICLLLAILMEIGDIVIVYVIRHEKQKTTSKIVSVESKPHLYRKTYEGY
jgi:hypothetical protein